MQNYGGKDYYTAKAQVVGMPGFTLASSNSNYKSKYHGLSQKTTIKTDIEATRSTTQAMWNVTLSDGARTSTCTFIPAVTFVCPDSKSSISLSLSSDYYLDSWDTFKEAVSVSRNVTCNPNSYSQS